MVLYDDGTTNNPIRGNSIFSNGFLGINSHTLGVIPNDPGDADIGPNNLQNYPVVTNAFGPAPAPSSRTLNSAAGQFFLIDVYRTASTDASGFGQGNFISARLG